jgi:hypothetical protein
MALGDRNQFLPMDVLDTIIADYGSSWALSAMRE